MEISNLNPNDRPEWAVLARGYKAFYETPTSDAEYDRAWSRLLERKNTFGLGARVDGKLVGIAHFLYHTTIWAPRSCYLQDLFTAPAARGHGVARALINAVAEQARTEGADRFYWLTQDENETARVLYDKVAKFRGFIRYDFPLNQ